MIAGAHVVVAEFLDPAQEIAKRTEVGSVHELLRIPDAERYHQITPYRCGRAGAAAIRRIPSRQPTSVEPISECIRLRSTRTPAMVSVDSRNVASSPLSAASSV